MPEKHNNDRRVQKTQKVLREALTSLIGEKPYDAIAVKEILDRANVGRSTFYMHFRDKDDLLVSGIHEMFGPLQSSINPISGKPAERILWFSLPIFQYHYQHRHLRAGKMGTRARAILHEHLRRVLAEVITGVAAKEFPGKRASERKVPEDLLSEYVASTFVLVLDWWVDRGMRQPPTNIDQLFRTLITPTLIAAWG